MGGNRWVVALGDKVGDAFLYFAVEASGFAHAPIVQRETKVLKLFMQALNAARAAKQPEIPLGLPAPVRSGPKALPLAVRAILAPVAPCLHPS